MLGYVLYVPEYYLRIVGAILSTCAFANPHRSARRVNIFDRIIGDTDGPRDGPLSCLPLLRRDATLPFFIPAPPLFLAGTFGAFIKMKSPIPSRRALFDIGLAGPLAGFVALLPIAVIGLLTLQAAAASARGSVIIFNDPLLIRIIAKFTGANLADAHA